MKYAVGSNMPGYMPDEPAFECDDLSEAKECLLTDITHYVEELNLDSRYTDDQVRGFSATIVEFDAADPQVCNVYVGDRVFWITEI